MENKNEFEILKNLESLAQNSEFDAVLVNVKDLRLLLGWREALEADLAVGDVIRRNLEDGYRRALQDAGLAQAHVRALEEELGNYRASSTK
jgi:hypothetical protein